MTGKKYSTIFELLQKGTGEKPHLLSLLWAQLLGRAEGPSWEPEEHHVCLLHTRVAWQNWPGIACLSQLFLCRVNFPFWTVVIGEGEADHVLLVLGVVVERNCRGI